MNNQPINLPGIDSRSASKFFTFFKRLIPPTQLFQWLLFFSFLLSGVVGYSQVAEWKEVTTQTGTEGLRYHDMVIDTTNNAFLIVGTDGNSSFVRKMDKNRQVVWTKSFADTKVENIDVDTEGNAYIAGEFSVREIIIGIHSLKNNYTGSYSNPGQPPSSDIFIAKLQAADGTVLWARTNDTRKFEEGENPCENALAEWEKPLPSMYNEYVNDIKVDALGGIFITGEFNSKSLLFDEIEIENPWHIDYMHQDDDSAGLVPDGEEDNCPYFGFRSIYTAKFNQASGDVQWLKTDEGNHFLQIDYENYYTNEQDNVFAGSKGSHLATDQAGNVYVSGLIRGENFIFGGNNLSSDVTKDTYLEFITVKYNASGGVTWAKTMLSGQMVYDPKLDVVFSVGTAIDIDNNGWFHSIKKISASGDILKEQKFTSYSDISVNTFKGIAIDRDTNVYLTGHFRERQDFEYTNITVEPTYKVNTYQDTCYLRSKGEGSMVVKYDKNLEAYWGTNSLVKCGGGENRATAIAIDSGKVYVAGFMGLGGAESIHKFGTENEVTASGDLKGYFTEIYQHPAVKIHLLHTNNNIQPTHIEFWHRFNKTKLVKLKPNEQQTNLGKELIGIYNPTLRTFKKVSEIFVLEDDKLLGKMSFKVDSKDLCDGRRKEAYVILHDDLTKYNHTKDADNNQWKYKEKFRYQYNALQADGLLVGESTNGGDFYQTTMFIAPPNPDKKGFVLEDPESEEKTKELLGSHPVVMVHGYTGTDQYWGKNFHNYNPGLDNPKDICGLGGSLQEDDFSGISDYLYTSYPARIQRKLEYTDKVWEFYYPPDQTWVASSYLFHKSLKILLERFYESNTKATVIAHSMGGLVVRGYIEGLAENYSTNVSPIPTTPIDFAAHNNIDKVLFLGTPHHGTFSGNRLYWGVYLPGVVNGFIKDVNAPAPRLLGAGHKIFDKLNNQEQLNNHRVPYFHIGGTTYKGNTSTLFTRPSEQISDFINPPLITESFNNDDGIVSISSGNLLQFGVPLGLLENFSHHHLNSPDNKIAISEMEKEYIPILASEFIKRTDIRSKNLFKWYGTSNENFEDELIHGKHKDELQLDVANPIVTLVNEDGSTFKPHNDGFRGHPMGFQLQVNRLKESTKTVGILKRVLAINPFSYNNKGYYLYYGGNNMLWNQLTPFGKFDKNKFRDEFESFYPYRVGNKGPSSLIPDAVDVFGGKYLKKVWQKIAYNIGDFSISNLPYQNPLDEFYFSTNVLDRINIKGRGLGWETAGRDTIKLPLFFGYEVPRDIDKFKEDPLIYANAPVIAPSFFGDQTDDFYENVNDGITIIKGLTTYNSVKLNATTALILNSSQYISNKFSSSLTDEDFLDNVITPDTPISSRRSNNITSQIWIDCHINNASFVLTYDENPIPDFRLIQPNGQSIDSTQANGDKIFFTHDPSLNIQIFTIVNPLPGKWKIVIDGSTDLPDSTYTLSYPISANNLNHTYIPDTITNILGNVFIDSLVIETTLSDSIISVANLKVDAIAIKNNVTTEKIDFNDSGEGADKVAGDQIFTGIFFPQDTGAYTIVTDIIGQMDGCNFIRENHIEVYALPKIQASNDVVLDEILLSEGGCDDPRTVKAIVTNKNQFSDLNTLHIVWETEAGKRDSLVWEGAINGYSTDTFELIDFQLASNESMDLKIWTSLPSGLTDINNYDDTLSLQIATRTYAGAYTVGGEQPDFINLTSAIAILDSVGICDTTTLLLRSGTYEERIEIVNGIKGVSLSTPLIITSESGNRADVVITSNATRNTSARENYTIFLKNTGNITFKNLTIQQQNIDDKTAGAIKLEACLYPNTFSNNLIQLERVGDDYLNSAPIHILYSNFAIFKNNEIVGGITGMFVEGRYNSDLGINNLISNNQFSNQTKYGIYAKLQENLNVIGNQINGTVGVNLIFVKNAKKVIIQQNELIGGENGIYSTDLIDVEISDNIINGMGTTSLIVSENSSNVQIKNNQLTGGIQNSIYTRNVQDLEISNNTIKSDGESVLITNKNARDVLIKSNQLSGGKIGVSLYGENKENPNTATRVEKNIIKNQSEQGISCTYQEQLTIEDNQLDFESTATGILIDASVGAIQIHRNQVRLNQSGFGVYIKETESTDLMPISIINNIVSINGSSTSYGIRVDNSQSAQVYFNNVNIYNSLVGSNAALVINNTSPTIIKNNNLVQIGNGFAASYFSVPNTNWEVNYNNYFSDWIISQDGNSYQSLTKWQEDTGQDLNSFNIDPQFNSDTDLHIQNSQLNGKATPIDGIVEDFDGEPRNENNPDIGADEIIATTIESASLSVGCSPKLIWSVSNESNIAYYVIEYGTANNALDSIAQVEANNNANVLNEYTYEPSFQLNKEAFMRIKLVQKDGGFSYSNLIELQEIHTDNNLTIANTISAPSSPTASNGAIQLLVTGGTGPYEYTWSNGNTTNHLQDIRVGYYEVVVHDAAGCTAKRIYDIKAPYLPISECYQWEDLLTYPSDGEVVLTDFTIDEAGNYYVTGNFKGEQLTFGNQVFNNPAQKETAFLIKLNTAKEVVWGKLFPATESSTSTSVILGKDRLFLIGDYKGTMQLGDQEMVDYNSINHFIGAFDRAGNLRWSQSHDGEEKMLNAVVGIDGNLLVLSDLYQYESNEFGIIRTSFVNLDGITLDGSIGGTLLLTSYDKETGKVNWFQQYGNRDSALGSHISRNKSGDLFISGLLRGDFQLGDFLLQEQPKEADRIADIYLAKCDGTNGNVSWAKSIAAAGSDNNTIQNIASSDGYLYTSGTFQDDIPFEMDTLRQLKSVNYAAYIAQFNQANGALNWVNALEGEAYTKIHKMAVDPNGNLYASLWNSYSLNYQGQVFTKNELNDKDLVKISKEGSIVFHKGSPLSDFHIRDDGNLVIGGDFTKNLILDKQTVQAGLNSTGVGRNIFFRELIATNQPTLDVQIIDRWDIDKSTGFASAIVSNGQPEYSYQWSSGADKRVLTQLNNQQYQLTVTDIENCYGTEAIFIGPKTTEINSCEQQVLEKATTLNGSIATLIRAATIDQQGNTYMVGHYGGDIKFSEDIILESEGQGAAPFLVKFDENNEVLMILKEDHSTFIEEFHDIHVDQRGFIYLTGVIKGQQLIFGGKRLNANGAGHDLMTLKINPKGKVVWAKNHSGLYDKFQAAITADSKGNTYVLGRTNSSMDFGAIEINTEGAYFVVKYGIGGGVQWVQEVEAASKIKRDAADNLYLLGGPTPITSFGTLRHLPAKVLKLNTNGDLLWKRTFEEAGVFSDFTLLADNQLLISGYSKEPAIQLANYTFTTDKELHSFYFKMDELGQISEAAHLDSIAIKQISKDGLGRTAVIFGHAFNGNRDKHYAATISNNNTLENLFKFEFDTPIDLLHSPIGATHIVGIDDPYCANNGQACGYSPLFIRTLAYRPVDTLVNFETTPILCEGETVTLDAGDGMAAYQWSTGAQTRTISVTTSGLYAVTVTADNGCQQQTSIEVAESIEVNIGEISIEKVSCSNADGKINLQPKGVAPFSFTWSNGSTSQNLADLNIGIYSVTVTDSLGCSKISEDIVVDSEADCENTALVLLVTNENNCTNEPVFFQINKIADEYRWDFGDGIISNTTTNSNSHQFTSTGKYDVQVTVVYPNGDSEQVSKTILIISSEATFDYSFNGYTLFVEADSIHAHQIEAYHWDFGPEKLTTTTTKANYTYASPGEYDVVLTTEGVCGAITVTKKVTVLSAVPESTILTCTDGIDNDNDELVDAADPDCDIALEGQLFCCDNFCIRLTATPATVGQSNGSVLMQPIGQGTAFSYGFSFSSPPFINFMPTDNQALLGENLSPGTYTLTIYDQNDANCRETISIIIEEVEETFIPIIEEIATSVEDISEKGDGLLVDFMMNPNPSSGKVVISIQAPINQERQIKVYNLTGQLVHKTHLAAGDRNNTTSLDFSINAAGVYIVQVSTSAKTISKLLVIQ